MDNTIKITALIPTYNRKEKLLDTLLALSKQNDTRFQVVISDNCSNYSIENEVLTELPIEFASKIRVHHQRFNIGGDHNIIGLLSLCDTEYGWLLGDDDHVSSVAIENIYQTIEKYPNINAFWFSIDTKVQTDTILKKLNELTTFLLQLNNQGDFIFCSNKVYKISSVAPYMDITYRFVYTCISQCLPLIEMLKSNHAVGIIGNKVLAKHGGFKGGKATWDASKVVSGCKTLIEYPTGLAWKEHCLFVKAIMFTPRFVLRQYIMSPDLPWNYKAYLSNVYTACYRFCYPWHKRIIIRTLFVLASYPTGRVFIKKIYGFHDKQKTIQS